MGETKDQKTRDQETRDQKTRDQETRDQETRDQETKDQETKDQETKDQETKDQETKDQETKDQETKDQETREREEEGHNDSHRHIVQQLVSYDAVSPAVEMSAVVLLKDNGCFPHCKEPATQEPPPHPLLDEDHVLCEDTVSLLFQ